MRQITGFPSDPREIDHFLFGGTRDWTNPLRALFADGDTEDWLIRFAQLLMAAKRPYDATYIDLSKSSRRPPNLTPSRCTAFGRRSKMRSYRGVCCSTQIC